jgi:voltage-gated potassium channel
VLALAAFPLLVTIGTVGYMVIEGWSASDALFMAATTITTVGFGEVRPLSEGGRLFTILLLLVGLAAVWYALSTLVSVVVEGELAGHWGERRMERHVYKLHGHHIVAGFGRVGRQAAQALRELGHQVVVIDEAPEAISDASACGFLSVQGNATEDATLVRAGVGRAAGLIAALGTDADNVFVTLSTRALNSTLPIVARANTSDVVPKLTRAGATQVVLPYAAAGHQLARVVSRARASERADGSLGVDTHRPHVDVLSVAPGSPLEGMTIEALAEQRPRAMLLAVLRDGVTIVSPALDLVLTCGDEVVVVDADKSPRSLVDVAHTGL